jgi:hypothetical protein
MVEARVEKYNIFRPTKLVLRERLMEEGDKALVTDR